MATSSALPEPPAVQPWGLRITYLVDPSGVLWHVAQRRPDVAHDRPDVHGVGASRRRRTVVSTVRSRHLHAAPDAFERREPFGVFPREPHRWRRAASLDGSPEHPPFGAL